MLDFLEPHIWMTTYNGGEFYKELGYDFDLFDYTRYRNLSLHGKRNYDQRKNHWQLKDLSFNRPLGLNNFSLHID